MFEQGRAALDLSVPLRTALCPNGDTVTYGGRQWHVAAWAQRFLFHPDGQVACQAGHHAPEPLFALDLG